MAKTCNISDCGLTVFCRGWCSKHYTRWQRHGDPLVILRAEAITEGDTEKKCPRCSTLKPLAEFGTRPNGGPKGYCRECEAVYMQDHAETPEGREMRRQHRAKWNKDNHGYFLNYRYGITVEDYERMVAEQGAHCAICGTDDPGSGNDVWCVDHCHQTDKIRGLLCNPCNMALGQFNRLAFRVRV